MMLIMVIIIGLASGIISGMGIGGGTILIPALVIFTGLEQHTAQSVNLLFFIPTAATALFIHIKKKRIDFKIAILVTLAGVAGAFLGSRLAVALPGFKLKKWFGIFLLLMGCYEFIRKGK